VSVDTLEIERAVDPEDGLVFPFLVAMEYAQEVL
jgi:hypothetical protein